MTVAVSVIFWVAVLVWLAYLVIDRDGLRNWLPWICTACVGVAVFGSAFRVLHL